MAKVTPTACAVILGALSLLMPASWGQLVASRDVTSGWSVPPEHVPGPPQDACPKVNYSVSPADKTKKVSPAEGERVELAIVQISPRQLTIGEEFTATV